MSQSSRYWQRLMPITCTSILMFKKYSVTSVNGYVEIGIPKIDPHFLSWSGESLRRSWEMSGRWLVSNLLTSLGQGRGDCNTRETTPTTLYCCMDCISDHRAVRFMIEPLSTNADGAPVMGGHSRNRRRKPTSRTLHTHSLHLLRLQTSQNRDSWAPTFLVSKGGNTTTCCGMSRGSRVA